LKTRTRSLIAQYCYQFLYTPKFPTDGFLLMRKNIFVFLQYTHNHAVKDNLSRKEILGDMVMFIYKLCKGSLKLENSTIQRYRFMLKFVLEERDYRSQTFVTLI